MSKAEIDAVLECVRSGAITPVTAARLIALHGVDPAEADAWVSKKPGDDPGKVLPFPTPSPLQCA